MKGASHLVPQFTIHTLGKLTITLDGQPVTGFNSRKVAALLVYLASTRHDHPREVLAEMLWEGRTQAQALANLRVALTSLRQTAGDFVLITRETAEMHPDAAWELDSAAFEDHLAVGRLSEALDLYQGDFLAGFYVDSPAFEDWAALERERLRFRAMDALDGLIVGCLEAGAYPDGLSHATRLLQMDPLREETHRAMMTLLASSGQRGAALAQFETCARALRKEIGITPTPETLDLYQQIKAGALPTVTRPNATPTAIEIDLTPIPTRRVHLPAQATRFIGREAEIAAVIAQVRDPACRLLTLLGPGGIGKTRLALTAAERVVEDFSYGVCFADLAPLHKPDDIPQAIATALGFQFYPGEEPPHQQILHYLRDKTLLLILDNCEHLLDGIDLAAAILAAAPGVTLLATSREVLKLDWEWVYPVEGLPIAGESESDAARLFVDRARRRQAGFDPASSARAIQRICALVDGMPLGIELAATWVGALSVDAIADEIGHSLDLLESDRRSGPDRHHSIRAVFDPTCTRLSPAEQDAFMRLSVFHGGFTREAAQAVAGASPRILLALLDCALLRFDADRGRYSLHELLRQYAAGRLAAAGQAEAAGEAHCHYYLDFVVNLESDLYGRHVREAMAAIEADIENIRTAWLYGVKHHHLRELRLAITLLRLFYQWRAQWRELYDLFSWTAQALEMAEPAGDQGAILGFAVCTMAAMRAFIPIPGWEETIALGNRGLAIVERLGSPRERIRAPWWTPTGDEQRALEIQSKALELARQTGEPFDIWLATRNLAAELMSHDKAKSKTLLRDALTLS